MRRRVPLIAAAATAALFPIPLPGQYIAQPAQSDPRVRVTMQVPAGLEYVGTLESWDTESLSLSVPEGPPERLELSEVAKVEVSRGMKGHAGIGAAIGTAVGLVGGYVVGFRSGDHEDDFVGDTRGLIVMISMIGGAALGAVTGALIRTEKWQSMAIPDIR